MYFHCSFLYASNFPFTFILALPGLVFQALLLACSVLCVCASALSAPYLVTGTGNFENYFSGSAVLWPFWHPKKLPCSRKMLLLQRNMSFNVYIAYNIPLFLPTLKALNYIHISLLLE